MNSMLLRVEELHHFLTYFLYCIKVGGLNLESARGRLCIKFIATHNKENNDQLIFARLNSILLIRYVHRGSSNKDLFLSFPAISETTKQLC